MNAPKYSARAARLLSAERRIRVPDDAARDRGLATMQRALAEGRRRTVRRRALGALLATAAAVALWFGVATAPSGSVEVVAFPLGEGGTVADAQSQHRLAAGDELAEGGSVSTPTGGGVRLELSTGTRLQLQERTALVVDQSDAVQRFRLSHGALHAKVAKLGAKDRFIVATPDSEVEVRGTAFDLSVVAADAACADGLRTRLLVSEGVVEVRHGGATVRVAAGERWPDPCEPIATAASSASTADSLVEAEPAAPEPAPANVPRHQSTPKAAPAVAATTAESQAEIERASAVREQNELFSRGIRAHQHGDDTTALDAFAQLLERHPHSALAESALARRMSILATRDPAAARRVAKRYLASYPQGFARGEAERVLGDDERP